VWIFAGFVCSFEPVGAAMITSERPVTSVEVLGTIELGTIETSQGDGSQRQFSSSTQFGALTSWFDIGLSDPNSPFMSGFSSQSTSSRSDGGVASVSSASKSSLLISPFSNQENGVFAISSANTGASSGLSSNGLISVRANSVVAAILVPQTRFPIPVLNRFWQGAGFEFVPPSVPDELLRPPQV
jgi:hypothetical protein